MIILKTIGWFIVLVPLMVIVYNVPLSALVSAYSKVRYGRVMTFPRMPSAFVALGMVATLLVAGAIIAMLDVDSAPVSYAAFLRVAVYGIFKY